MSVKNTNTLILLKRTNTFYAADDYAVEMMEKIQNDTEVSVTFSVNRNAKHHRKFFVLLGIVHKAQTEPRAFPTVDSLLDAIKYAIGHVRYFKDLQGQYHAVPASISWGSMDQVKFSEFYESAVVVILEKIIPNIKRSDLEQILYDVLGEAGPDAIRGY